MGEAWQGEEKAEKGRRAKTEKRKGGKQRKGDQGFLAKLSKLQKPLERKDVSSRFSPNPDEQISAMADPDDPGGGGGYGDDAGGGGQSALARPDKVAAHLARVAAVMLEDADATVLGVLSERRQMEAVAKFVGDPHAKTLLIERFVGAKEDEQEEEGGADGAGGAGPDSGHPSSVSGGAGGDALNLYAVSLNVHFSNARTASVVFVKRSATLEAEKSVGAQLRVMSLSDGSPYETLHSYVSTAVAPYFKSFVRESGKADRDGDKMATSMEKKIAELEMGLLHLQQNIDIPEITLTVHPLIMQVRNYI